MDHLGGRSVLHQSGNSQLAAGEVIPRWLPYAAALALLGLVGWRGYVMGHSVATAAHNAELLEQIEVGQKLDQARVHAEIERDKLARELEEQAYADPIAVDRALSPDRVRRLNAIH